MLNKLNLAKALLISTLCSAVYQFYFATTMFVLELTTQNYTPGRLEAFIEVSKTTVDFWPRVFEAWLQSFVLVFFACFALLWWLKFSPPGKSVNTDA